jgi:hypothetical protein
MFVSPKRTSPPTWWSLHISFVSCCLALYWHNCKRIELSSLPLTDSDALFALRSFLRLDQQFLKTHQVVGYVKIFDLQGCSMGQVKFVRAWNRVNVERQQRLGVDLAGITYWNRVVIKGDLRTFCHLKSKSNLLYVKRDLLVLGLCALQNAIQNGFPRC